MTKILSPLSSQIVAYDETCVLERDAREEFFITKGNEKKMLCAYDVKGGAAHEVFLEVGEGAFCDVNLLYRVYEKGAKMCVRVCILLQRNATISCDVASMCEVAACASDVRVFVVFNEGAKATVRTYTRVSEPRSMVHEEIRGLTLGDAASVSFIPELSLLHDDIVATHATSVVKIDEKRFAYFLSRGVSRDCAIKCLVDAFLAR